ncbi:MAG TPA: hypothetical protein VK469_17775 [Candidatus Kapabacteria bacterium]|nr:hypothetical protein [Candidatus Kapabacteria bacterium]
MRRIIILFLVLLFVLNFAGYVYAGEQGEEQKKETQPPRDMVTKTYVLKHLTSRSVPHALTQYVWSKSYDNVGNMLTVTMARENVAKFEELLKQLDIEKKKILIRIFTVIASREHKGSDIQDKELKQVLNELQKVLSFNSYTLDGVSAVTVMEDQDYSRLALSSQSPLRFDIEHIRIQGDKPGKRSVAFEFALRQNQEIPNSDGKVTYEELIASETSVKEKGYLVAGVSKIGKNGDSLVLIINAEIL